MLNKRRRNLTTNSCNYLLNGYNILLNRSTYCITNYKAKFGVFKFKPDKYPGLDKIMESIGNMFK